MAKRKVKPGRAIRWTDEQIDQMSVPDEEIIALAKAFIPRKWRPLWDATLKEDTQIGGPDSA